jgi:hypothetical protein
MTDITKKAIEPEKKKISCDISVEGLEMIDELAKISFCTRTEILNAIIFPGIKGQVDFMIKIWKELMKNDSRYQSKGPQEKLKKLLIDIEEFKKKWALEENFEYLNKYVNKSKK